jgi:hypothetical protein
VLRYPARGVEIFKGVSCYPNPIFLVTLPDISKP